MKNLVSSIACLCRALATKMKEEIARERERGDSRVIQKVFKGFIQNSTTVNKKTLLQFLKEMKFFTGKLKKNENGIKLL